MFVEQAYHDRERYSSAGLRIRPFSSMNDKTRLQSASRFSKSRLPTIMSWDLALVNATFKRRGSAVNPIVLERTVDSTMTSFSFPWKASTVENWNGDSPIFRWNAVHCAAYSEMTPRETDGETH